ncbi:hypothetical protein B0A49_02074 [Cryomyces minteri]|uniref:Uncharacterized protein n=1 Tax=Cryomyces minteri TaxID=331657 RepID=A0A4U0XUV2_9PEZI|nr:hypothetical protein B0A49_02074 [Cryomyces minteri]
MSPVDVHKATQLRQLTYYHLDNDLLDNAVFLAGRLHAAEPRSPEAAHLLALSYLRLKRPKAAYDYSHKHGASGRHLGCAYVFALACLDLGRHTDGITALEKSRALWAGRNNWNKHSETSRRHLPDAAAVNCLLGKLWRGHGDARRAADCLVEAQKANPFIWDAFQGLCDISANVNPSKAFQMTPQMIASLPVPPNVRMPQEYQDDPVSIANEPAKVNSGQIVATPGNDPFNPSVRTAGDVGLNLGGPNLLSRLNGGIYPPPGVGRIQETETPTANGRNEDDDVMMGDAGGPSMATRQLDERPKAAIRRARALQTADVDSAARATISSSRLEKPKSNEGDDRGLLNAMKAHRMPTNHKRTVSGHTSQGSTTANEDLTAAPQRRSVRLLNNFNLRPSSTKTNSSAVGVTSKESRELKKVKATGTRGRTTVGRVVSGNRAQIPSEDTSHKEPRAPSRNGETAAPPIKARAPAISPEQEALQELLDLFQKLGTGYHALSRYQCQAATQCFSSLPPQQRDTPWVLAQLGKAYYEKASYKEAEEVFQRILKIAPSRIEDMEVYSTVLWHLKSDVQLASLSHLLHAADRLSPQAWCALGNAYSLSREHEHAIACFQRAVQLDKSFAYAHTLQGHEYVASEEYDKAQRAYRSAIMVDKRHYNGWYGLGKCYERMGKYEIAEKHYRSAAQINPSNAVLVVCIGHVLEKLRRPQPALAQYSHACALDPRSALARFKKARVLMALRQPREALVELEVLKNIAPDEANVYFLLGRVYKGLGDKTAAIRNFTCALNLDPKAAQYIKEAMESLDDSEDDEAD